MLSVEQDAYGSKLQALPGGFLGFPELNSRISRLRPALQDCAGSLSWPVGEESRDREKDKCCRDGQQEPEKCPIDNRGPHLEELLPGQRVYPLCSRRQPSTLAAERQL